MRRQTAVLEAHQKGRVGTAGVTALIPFAWEMGINAEKTYLLRLVDPFLYLLLTTSTLCLDPLPHRWVSHSFSPMRGKVL